jgi:hypothetical protein
MYVNTQHHAIKSLSKLPDLFLIFQLPQCLGIKLERVQITNEQKLRMSGKK